MVRQATTVIIRVRKATVRELRVTVRAHRVMAIIRITTGRDISNMVRVMAEVLMETTLTTVLQEISVVTFGVLIRFVNVWEEIFAVAFKIKTGGMVRYHYGIYGDITDSIRHYRDKLTFSSCGSFFFSRMR